MSSVNKVILIGRGGKDPVVKYMPNGEAVATLSIATSESWKDKQTGEQREKTEWHNLVFYRKLAEIVGEYVKKGSQIYVEGKLQTRQWEKEGQKHYTTEIIVESMTMLGGKSDGGQHQAPQAAPQPAPQRPAQQSAPANLASSYDNFDDDIQF